MQMGYVGPQVMGLRGRSYTSRADGEPLVPCGKRVMAHISPSQPPPERRSFRRYDLSAPVLYRWIGDDGTERHGGGFTRDVSTGGMYITCEDDPPPVGAPVAIDVSFPTLDARLAGLKLKAKANVVRRGGSSEGKGFAILTDLAEDSLTRHS
jgi:hypothetical protein